MFWLVIDKDSRFIVIIVYYDVIVYIGVIGVCSFNVGNSR